MVEIGYSRRMAKHISLTPNERIELEQLIKSGQHKARTIARARVLLLLDRRDGQRRRMQDVAEATLVSRTAVHHVKKRYLAGGLPRALYDQTRPSPPPKIMTGAVEAQLLALACSPPPEQHHRWTLRLLAEKLVELEVVASISHVTVGETLKKTNLSLGA